MAVAAISASISWLPNFSHHFRVGQHGIKDLIWNPRLPGQSHVFVKYLFLPCLVWLVWRAVYQSTEKVQEASTMAKMPLTQTDQVVVLSLVLIYFGPECHCFCLLLRLLLLFLFVCSAFKLLQTRACSWIWGMHSAFYDVRPRNEHPEKAVMSPSGQKLTLSQKT